MRRGITPPVDDAHAGRCRRLHSRGMAGWDVPLTSETIYDPVSLPLRKSVTDFGWRGGRNELWGSPAIRRLPWTVPGTVTPVSKYWGPSVEADIGLIHLVAIRAGGSPVHWGDFFPGGDATPANKYFES